MAVESIHTPGINDLVERPVQAIERTAEIEQVTAKLERVLLVHGIPLVQPVAWAVVANIKHGVSSLNVGGTIVEGIAGHKRELHQAAGDVVLRVVGCAEELMFVKAIPTDQDIGNQSWSKGMGPANHLVLTPRGVDIFV